MTRILRDADVRTCLTPALGVDFVARGVASAWAQEQRSDARSIVRVAGGWLRTTSGALIDEDVLGFKTFQLVPGHGVRYLTSLYRLSTGEALALLDANHLTVVRTSAAAAAAARRHWGPEPIRRRGDRQRPPGARRAARARRCMFRNRGARLFPATAASREFRGGPQRGAGAAHRSNRRPPRGGGRRADMVMCATQTGGTVALRAEDVDNPSFISSVSSTLPAQRELDERLIGAAEHVVIDTPDAIEGVWRPACRGRPVGCHPGLHPGRIPIRSTADEVRAHGL